MATEDAGGAGGAGAAGAAGAAEDSLEITPEVVRAMKRSRVTPASGKRGFNSIDMHRQGEYLVAATNDDAIAVFDALRSTTHSRSAVSDTFGARLVRCTHNDAAILYASNRPGDAARCGQLHYHSMHDNKYLAHFQGHTAPVTALEMCPRSDTFASAAGDSTVRLWDLRERRGVSLARIPAAAAAPSVCLAFDPMGVVFAAAYASPGVDAQVALFDSRNLAAGPFATFQLPAAGRPQAPTALVFSPDNSVLAVGTDQHSVCLLDSFSGHALRSLTGPELQSPAKADHWLAFSGDSSTLAVGSESGATLLYKASDGSLLTSCTGHASGVRAVAWNPLRVCLVTAASNQLQWWLPDTRAPAATDAAAAAGATTDAGAAAGGSGGSQTAVVS